jgi:hypothetical protein
MQWKDERRSTYRGTKSTKGYLSPGLTLCLTSERGAIKDADEKITGGRT